MATVIEKNKTERLVARVNPQEKALIQKAAAIEGRKVARFVVQNAVQRARKVIQEAETIRLNEAESSHFIETLLAPPRKPSPEFKRAFKAYRDTVVSDVNQAH